MKSVSVCGSMYGHGRKAAVPNNCIEDNVVHSLEDKLDALSNVTLWRDLAVMHELNTQPTSISRGMLSHSLSRTDLTSLYQLFLWTRCSYAVDYVMQPRLPMCVKMQRAPMLMQCEAHLKLRLPDYDMWVRWFDCDACTSIELDSKTTPHIPTRCGIVPNRYDNDIIEIRNTSGEALRLSGDHRSCYPIQLVGKEFGVNYSEFRECDQQLKHTLAGVFSLKERVFNRPMPRSFSADWMRCVLLAYNA